MFVFSIFIVRINLWKTSKFWLNISDKTWSSALFCGSWWNYNAEEKWIPFSNTKNFFLHLLDTSKQPNTTAFFSSRRQQSPPRTTHTCWPRYLATRPTCHVSNHSVWLQRRSDDSVFSMNSSKALTRHREESFFCSCRTHTSFHHLYISAQCCRFLQNPAQCSKMLHISAHRQKWECFVWAFFFLD